MWTVVHHSTASLHLCSCSYLVFLTPQAHNAKRDSSRAFESKPSFTLTLRKYSLSIQRYNTTMWWCAIDAHDPYNPCQRRWMCTDKILTFPARFPFFLNVGGGGFVVEVFPIEYADVKRMKLQWKQSKRRYQTMPRWSLYNLTTTVSSSEGWKQYSSTTNAFYYHHCFFLGQNWACCWTS